MVFFVISTIAFNNCSGKFEAQNSIRSITNSSSQCQQKMRSMLKLADHGDVQMCNDPANYQCDLRSFRPGVVSGKTQTTQCTAVAGIGEVCIPVVTYGYNTSAQRATASTEDLLEGGAYNRDEASCINTKIVSHDVALVQAEGTNVSATLEKTIEECRRRSRP